MNNAALNPPPTLSIAIASWSGESTLVRCLESVLPQAGSAEVIVAYRGVTDLRQSLGRRYPNVKFIPAPSDASVFLLRSLAVHPATGNTIAMLEDHAAVGPAWARSIADARSRGWKIFGGPIDNAEPSTAYDWALYFVEYGIYLPPMPAGETNILSGVNIAYDRELLLSCSAIWKTVFYETDVNAALTSAGHKLYLVPDGAVSSRLRMEFSEAMEHLYTGGKHYGKFRKVVSTPLQRAILVLAAPAVPFVLLLRIVRLTLSRRLSRFVQLLMGLPALLLLLAAWSAGEAVSYARATSTSDIKS